MINQVILMGRVSNEYKSFGSNGLLKIAVNEYSFKQKKEVCNFFDCKCFGKTHDFASSLSKGTVVALECKLYRNNWQDKNKQWHDTLDIIVKKVHAGGNKEGGNVEKTSNVVIDEPPF